MIDNRKLISYFLLLAYDFEKVVNEVTEFIKSLRDDELTLKYEKFKNRFYAEGGLPINIYTLDENWDEFCYDLSTLYRFIIRWPIIGTEDTLLLIRGYNIESVIFDSNTLAKRFSYIINKYHYLSYFLNKIFVNYLDLNKYHKDIKIGTSEFDYVILKKINKGGDHLTSNRMLKNLREYFRNHEKMTFKINKTIFDNLPFDFLNKIQTTNKNKINLFFQRELAVKLLQYLDKTTALPTVKEKMLGFAFAAGPFVYSKEDFIKQKMASDKDYQYEEKDYHDYLRTEGKNVYIKLCKPAR